MKPLDLENVKKALDKAVDARLGSELEHLLKYMQEIIDGIEFDIASGNYSGANVKVVVRQQLLGSLDEFEASCRIMETKIKEVLK